MRVKLYVFETICQSCATFYVCIEGVLLYAPYNYRKQCYSTTSGCSSNRVTLIWLDLNYYLLKYNTSPKPSDDLNLGEK